MGILDNKSRSQPTSSLAKDKAINSTSMVDLAIIYCFLDFQLIAPPPIVNTQPVVDKKSPDKVFQLASLYPSRIAGYL